WANQDLLREQTNGLANSRRESDNSAVERAHHLKPILGIREHLSEKENQVLAPEEQIEQEQCYEGKNLELGDNNGKLDALMIDHETDLLREQKTKGLANSRRESDNSEVERAHHIKPVLGIREHLSEKDNQVLALEEQIFCCPRFSLYLTLHFYVVRTPLY
uniref:Uncharacterized protein n=1 Tax=Aegilops tauschii subsp. strangulata TaxID=200361 RepID=A0A452YIS8_AEGTS